METSIKTARDHIRTTTRWALWVTFSLTLALWSAPEAATAYSFIGFDAPLPGVVSTTSTGVDYASGQLVGTYRDVHGNTHGWRGNKNAATMVPLLPLAGINRLKWTVGSFRPTPPLGTPPNHDRQGLLLKGTEMIPITVPGCPQVEAHAVNEAGEVVGSCDGYDAWHYQNGVVTLLDPERQIWCNAFGFAAKGINTAGVITGTCTDTGFIYDHGQWTFFNGSHGQIQACVYPHGINDTGTVFGHACEDQDDYFDQECAGFLFKGGVMRFVEYPGAQRTGVTATHPSASNGRIWGNWQDGAGVWHVFTAMPKQGSARASEEVALR